MSVAEYLNGARYSSPKGPVRCTMDIALARTGMHGDRADLQWTRRAPQLPGARQSQAQSGLGADIRLLWSGATVRRLPWFALPPTADTPAGMCVYAAPPAGSYPGCPSTDKGSPVHSARDARFPWR